MAEKDKPYYLFKICLLGQAAVGKTCLAKRLCLDTFDLNTKLTIGIDFYTYDFPIRVIKDQEDYIRLSLWDFGGQEQFKKLFPYYINGANGVLMVFDLTNLQSLINLDFWYEQLSIQKISNVPRIIVGTKNDLIVTEDKKNNLIIEQYLQNHDERFYYRTSSKVNYNVSLVFNELAKFILDQSKLDYDQLI